MRYLSVCSGIEAASVAWRPMGWAPVGFAETSAFPCAVLAHRFPDVRNFGDVTAFRGWPDAAVDVLVGGTPCQSFSIAGLRAGLADPRGNLALTYLAIVERYRPDWLVWENVPGVLSSNGGRDFASFLGGVGQLRYGWAYRVLDAQYFRVAQRRRRVFVVGCARGWAAAAAVLFELASLRGDSATSGAPRETDSETTPTGAGRGGEPNAELVAHTLRGTGFDASEDGSGRGSPLVVGAVSAKWRKRTGGPSGDECYNLVPFDVTQLTHRENRSNPQPGDPSPTLARAARPPTIAFSCKDFGQDVGELAPTLRAMAATNANPNAGGQVAIARFGGGGVRRLTPLECERLQGLPDNWTLIPYRGHLAKDGPRYEAIGNSMAVPVVRWVGERIALVDDLLREAVA